MFEWLLKRKNDHVGLTKEEVAELLKIDKTALEEFEKSYEIHALTDSMPENFFEVNAKQAAELHEGVEVAAEYDIDSLIERIVAELVNLTPIYEFDGKRIAIHQAENRDNENPVKLEEILKIPENLRPQLTGTLAKKDISEPSYPALLMTYQKSLKERNPVKKKLGYDIFRQGLELLDLDPITYRIIDMNRNSIGHWFPQIAEASLHQDFFKIPETKIIKVPLTLLQLTKIDYELLTRTTLDIVDRFCQKVFHLDEEKEYFIKNGVYSSKYDFRNARVKGAKEVRELGEYLLFIHHQACMMAGPLNNISIYGPGTTVEWVVREYIHDEENNPCIYKGLPLHTEYRLFVDFDTKKVIGMNPYWDPDVMKKRFGHSEDSDSPHNVHDYIIYRMHEQTLMERYNQNKDLVKEKLEKMLESVEGLTGQWSVDVMQNGNDFWIIDMAIAVNSALVECVPKGLLKPVEENWIPRLEVQ